MSPPIQAWLKAEAMDRGYMLRAMPMSVMAKFTVSSSGALSMVRRRAALSRTAVFPKIDRMAAENERGSKRERERASERGIFFLKKHLRHIKQQMNAIYVM